MKHVFRWQELLRKMQATQHFATVSSTIAQRLVCVEKTFRDTINVEIAQITFRAFFINSSRFIIYGSDPIVFWTAFSACDRAIPNAVSASVASCCKELPVVELN